MTASTFRVERTPINAAQVEEIRAPIKPAGFQRAALTTTVPKEYVHRAAVAEVMLTDWARVDESNFVLAAQWPRRHGFFTPIDDCHDPLLIAETIRQAGILLSHTEFGVPLDHHFLLSDLSVEVRPEHIGIGAAPASVELEVSCTDIKRRRGALAGFRINVTILRDGHIAATGSGSSTFVSPAVHDRLRSMQLTDEARGQLPLTAPVAPQTVGRLSPTDVVLSPTAQEHCWQLRVDTRHPILFDHPVDHIPGMVLLEAARQATAAHLGRSCMPLSMTSDFMRYAELDSPCMIEARRVPGTEPGYESVLVSGHQDGEVVFRSTLTVASAAV